MHGASQARPEGAREEQKRRCPRPLFRSGSGQNPPLGRARGPSVTRDFADFRPLPRRFAIARRTRPKHSTGQHDEASSRTRDRPRRRRGKTADAAHPRSL
jgi:hypothetical protein